VNANDFGQLFESFTVSAFRLECLPAYDVTEDAEREAFRRWRAGEQPQRDRAWLQTVRDAKERGAQMQRVRLVESPLTEYQRFELAHGYPANVAAGEDIRICGHRPDGLSGAASCPGIGTWSSCRRSSSRTRSQETATETARASRVQGRRSCTASRRCTPQPQWGRT
jgi:hypothetical protein